jgi:hypothetical protein
VAMVRTRQAKILRARQAAVTMERKGQAAKLFGKSKYKKYTIAAIMTKIESVKNPCKPQLN